ncbi:zinc ribbon domain-containing protein [Nocardia sp. NPDC101769]|uniref:zinc ribbon domain-containing protein n=1 Tax=Nocardia sp. NPDC101769 TaxID=3364333 RepID=UPI00382F88DE
MNTRLSQQVRGKIADRIRHLAAEVGIAVVTVPARNTSKQCPACLTPLRHRKAPDRVTEPGWKWAICPNPDCGWHGDRDTGAWQRIAARGLTHQSRSVTDRATPTFIVRAVDDTLEAHAVVTGRVSRNRSKTGPTNTRPAPRRRGVPSPSRSRMGQRPEGRVSTDRCLPRAAHRNQDMNAISCEPVTRHQPGGAALGAGFHRNAHATPPRWEPTLHDPTTTVGSHRITQPIRDAESTHWPVGGDGDTGTRFRCCRRGNDGGPRARRSIGVEKVSRGIDLAIEVVCSAHRAQPATAHEDAAVAQRCHGLVPTGNGQRRGVLPHVVSGIVDAGLTGVAAAGDE